MLTTAALSALRASALTLIPRCQTVEVADLSVTDAPYFPYGFSGDRDPWSTRHTFNQTISFWDKYSGDHLEYSRVGTDGKPVPSIALGHAEVIEPIVAEALAFFGSDRPSGENHFLVIPADACGTATVIGVSRGSIWTGTRGGSYRTSWRRPP